MNLTRFRNTTQKYGSVAKFFHWLMALLIIGLLCIGFLMGDIGDKNTKMQIYNMHKLTGLTVLSLVILRLFWRLINPIPVLENMPRWEMRLEKTVKFLLYVVMFAMPLSGWIFSSAAGYFPHIGNLQIPAPFVPKNKMLAHDFNQVHIFLAWSMMILLCLHIIGGLKHHFINKDNVLKRMMPNFKGEK